MRSWTLAAAFAASLTLSIPALAQDPGASAPSPRGRGGFGMMRGQGRMEAPDPVVLKGPPAPEEFARITELEDAQRERYAGLHQRFMANTQPQRDSLKIAFDAMREAFRTGDREGARAQRPAVQELREGLAEQQKHFDETLKEFLSNDQWKKYENWRKEERDRVKKQWRERRSRPA